MAKKRSPDRPEAILPKALTTVDGFYELIEVLLDTDRMRRSASPGASARLLRPMKRRRPASTGCRPSWRIFSGNRSFPEGSPAWFFSAISAGSGS